MDAAREKITILNVLNLTLYVKNVISFFHKQKIWLNSNVQNLFAQKFNFDLYFPVNQQFEHNRQFTMSL